MPAHALNEAVAAELNDLRIRTGITFETIAAEAGIHTLTAKRYLHGERPIPVTALASIAAALGDEPMAVFIRAQARVQRED